MEISPFAHEDSDVCFSTIQSLCMLRVALRISLALQCSLKKERRRKLLTAIKAELLLLRFLLVDDSVCGTVGVMEG